MQELAYGHESQPTTFTSPQYQILSLLTFDNAFANNTRLYKQQLKEKGLPLKRDEPIPFLVDEPCKNFNKHNKQP